MNSCTRSASTTRRVAARLAAVHDARQGARVTSPRSTFLPGDDGAPASSSAAKRRTAGRLRTPAPPRPPKRTPEQMELARMQRDRHRGAVAAAHPARRLQRAPARRGDGRFLDEPLQRVRRQGAGAGLPDRVRARRDSPARARQVPRPARRQRGQSRDALLSRQLAEHRGDPTRRRPRTPSGCAPCAGRGRFRATPRCGRPGELRARCAVGPAADQPMADGTQPPQASAAAD